MSIKSIPASYPYLSAAFALALSSYLAMGLFKSKWNPKGLVSKFSVKINLKLKNCTNFVSNKNAALLCDGRKLGLRARGGKTSSFKRR